MSKARPDRKLWYIAQWPPLAWLETAIKLAALVIGIGALLSTLGGGRLTLPAGSQLAQLIILAVLSQGLVTAIFDRIMEREIVALAFVVLNNLGHWGMTVLLLTSTEPTSRLLPFAALMLLGDLVKRAFLRVHQFQMRNTPRAAPYGLTLLYAAGYTAILLVQLLT